MTFFNNRSTRFSILVLAAALLCSCAPDAGAPEPPATDFIGKSGLGQDIALRECSSCHSLSWSGQSPHPDAPAFRDLSQNYPVRDLAESLAEGIMVGHPDMPVFSFNPEEVDALIDYLESLQAPRPT